MSSVNGSVDVIGMNNELSYIRFRDKNKKQVQTKILSRRRRIIKMVCSHSKIKVQTSIKQDSLTD